MSNEYRNIDFSILIADTDHWTEGQIAGFRKCRMCGMSGDHALHLLRNAMMTAGNQFITENPEMFRWEELT